MYTFRPYFGYTLCMKNKPFPIAILQGRLSPDVEARYQFFPKDGWRDEFKKAKEIGFDGIEWLVDPIGWEENPIFSSLFDEAEDVARSTSLPITSVCADWFMGVCIWEGEAEMHREKIRSILSCVQRTKNKVLLIPLLEKHNISLLNIQKKIVDVLKPLAPELEAAGVSIGFETELSAQELMRFLQGFESDAFGVYYDIGNCTSYGFNCPEDIRVLENRIKGIHIKDRRVGTTTPVRLGDGDADFKGVIQALTETDWTGTLVMQAWRGGQYVDDAREQLLYIRNIIN